MRIIDPTLYTTLTLLMHVYLYIGTGNPCAGQKRVRSFPSTRSYQANFASLENFGFFVATGSNERIKLKVDRSPLILLNFLKVKRSYYKLRISITIIPLYYGITCIVKAETLKRDI